MAAVERILCPVDLSDASRRALDYTQALARRHDAALRVLHVVDLHGRAGAGIDGLDAAAGATQVALEEQLGWWVARGLDGASGAATEVRQGAVVSGILDAAAQMSADVIVMATHGRGGFERLALGSVAEKTVRKATCPVLVIPARPDAIVRAGVLSRVVCAVDFSASSAPALDWANVMAGDVRTPLSLITVVDWPSGGEPGTDPVGALRSGLEQQAVESLHRLAAEAGFGPPAAVVVRHGHAAREVLRYAREVHAELIVVGVSGRGALDRALLGSTAEHVLRDAPCPVLAVPAPGGGG